MVRRLAAIDAGIFASRAYLAERGAPRRPADLAKHECILQSRTPPKTRWTLRGPAGVTEVTVRGRITVDDQSSAMGAATAGGGLVVLPVHAVERDPSASSLQRVLPSYDIPGEAAQLVYAASRHVPLRISMFCDALIATCKASCKAS